MRYTTPATAIDQHNKRSVMVRLAPALPTHILTIPSITAGASHPAPRSRYPPTIPNPLFVFSEPLCPTQRHTAP